MRFSDFSRISEDPWTASWASRQLRKHLIGTLGPVRRKTQDDASCPFLKTKYLLMLVSRCKVLGTRRCSVARIAIVQSVLREETAIVLVHSTGPENRAFREVYPGPVFRLDLSLHGCRRPLQVPSHVACCRSFGRCRLGLVHRCWCLEIKIRETRSIKQRRNVE